MPISDEERNRIMSLYLYARLQATKASRISFVEKVLPPTVVDEAIACAEKSGGDAYTVAHAYFTAHSLGFARAMEAIRGG